ncbi:MAG: NifB/NifX family molybdenum-iron cluster-binding protein [Bacillota bacterium]
MRLAFATEGGYVSGHFGHCAEFLLVDVEGGAVKGTVFVPNPGHQPGFLPQYLGDLGVTHVIAGGMGARAQELFLARGISPVVGAQGPVSEVLDAFLAGKLVTGPSLCDRGTEGHVHRCGGGCGGHDR